MNCVCCRTSYLLQIEDEIYVLLSCLKYEQSRKDLLDVIRSNCQKLNKMQSEEQFRLTAFEIPMAQLSERLLSFIF